MTVPFVLNDIELICLKFFLPLVLRVIYARLISVHQLIIDSGGKLRDPEPEKWM